MFDFIKKNEKKIKYNQNHLKINAFLNYYIYKGGK